jgi:hypothetical protein
MASPARRLRHRLRHQARQTRHPPHLPLSRPLTEVVFREVVPCPAKPSLLCSCIFPNSNDRLHIAAEEALELAATVPATARVAAPSAAGGTVTRKGRVAG